MTVAEVKAKEIYDKFSDELAGALHSPHNTATIKACALIHVEGIMEVCPLDEPNWKDEPEASWSVNEGYWREVKEALNKMQV